MENSSRIGRKSRKLGSRRQYRMREVHDEDAPDVPDTEQLPSQATEELQDFFQECGADHKGFVTREDLGKAKFSFLGSPEELELIFDWMDLDRKGRLTLKEFTSGLKNVFSSQTKIPRPRKRKTRTWIFSKEEPTSLQSLEEADPEEKRWFLSFMEQLGADHSFLDQAEIWQLWKNLRQEEPHLVGNLEGFLAKVTSRLQETRAEKEALQMTLKKCDDDHHREVRQLYEELEQQIHSEKQRLQAASNTQGLAYSSMMHQALEAKEQEVQHLAKGQRELEAQIDLLRSKRQEVSMENQRLQETQKDLTGQLEQVRGQLQVTRGHLNLAKGQVSWQVEEKTSLTSDPPVGPKNTSGSQHLDFFPEEDPLPSLFEEGDWSQLLSNFTSPLPGNTTQVSWSPPPTPTSLQGHHTPRVVRQISITKPNSWGLKQESPSDSEVTPRSPPEPSTAPATVPELSVVGEPRPEKTFQWDFQRVPSGEPAITTGGQATPVLGDSLDNSNSLSSQNLAGSSKGIGDTNGVELGQGEGPTLDLLSSSEEPLQTLGPSADFQTNAWEVGPEAAPHPAGSEQEVGSWGKEGFTSGPDVPIETTDPVLIQESVPMRDPEQEKTNTDGWEIGASQQNDVSGQETGFRESPGPDVENSPSQEAGLTESPGPDIGNPHAQETGHNESPRLNVDGFLSQEDQFLKSLGVDVGKTPGHETQFIDLARVMELPEIVMGNVSEKETEPIMPPRADADDASAQELGVLELVKLDVGNAPYEKVRLLESSELERKNHSGQEIGLLQSLGPEADIYPSYEARPLGPDQQDVGNVTEFRRLIGSYVPNQKARFRTSPETYALSQGSGLTEEPWPDGDDVSGQEIRFIESCEIDISNAFGNEAQVLHSIGPDVGDATSEGIRLIESPDVGDTPRHENILIDSPGPDMQNATEQEAWTSVGDTTVEQARATELSKSDVGNVPDQGVGLIEPPELDSGDVSGQETGLIEPGEIDMEDTSGQEAEILHSSDLDIGDVLGQRVRLSGSDVSEVQEAGLMESSVIKLSNSPGWEDKFMGSTKTDVVMDAIQESGLIDVESEIYVGNIHGQEAGLSKSPGPDGDANFLCSPSSDVGILTLEARLIESTKMDRDDVNIQGPGVTELSKIVGDASDQETSPKTGTPSEEIKSSRPEMGNTLVQESRLRESWEIDIGDTPGQEAEKLHSYGPQVSNIHGQEAESTKLSVFNLKDYFSHKRELESSEEGGDDGYSQVIGQTGSPGLDVRDVLGQEISIRESCEMAEEDTLGPMESSSVVTLRETSVQEGRFLESPEESMDDGSSQVTEQTGLAESDVRDALDQEARFRESYETDLRGALGKEVEILYSFGPDGDNASGQGILMLEPHDIGDASRPGQIAGYMESWGPEMGDIPREEAKIMYSPGPDLGDAFGQEAKFQELGKKDGGDTEVIYSPGLDMSVSSGQEAGVMEVHGLSESESSIQEARDLVLPESEVSDGLGQEVMMRETHEADVGNASAQGTELAHSPGPGVSDSVGQEVESMHSPGPSVGDSSGQEAEVTELHRADVGKAENTRSMSPSEMDMNDAPGQEISIRESCEMAEEDTLGPMESSSVVTLRETSVQEGRFLESPEESMDDGSSQITEQTGSAEPDVRDALDQEARFRESYETDLRGTLGKEVEVLYSFGPDGDDASGQGILMLEPHEADIGDASRPGQIAGFMESWGPEMGDIPGEEANIMHSPGPDMSVSSGQEAGVMEVHGLSESESSIQEARDLVLPESEVSDGLGQEVMMRETHEADVGNASAQGTELAHSPGPGVSDSVGQEVESMHSPGPSVGDSSGQEAEVTELHRADVGKAENTRSMSPSEMDMNDAPGQEISIRESCEMAEEDTLGPMESSSVVTLRETSVQEGRFLESPEESMDDGSSQVTEQTGSAEPDVRDALDQEARFRESYETDLRSTLGKEVEVLYSFGPDGDDASGQGILMLEPHEADIGDASHPGQIAGFMESWGPEMGDIPGEEANIMHSPGPDMSVSSGQEAGVMEVHGLSESESSIQEARDLVLPESGVSDGLGQEVMMRETHEADVGNASAQGTELAHSPGPGVSDSVGQEVESMHSPGPSVGDSSGQEAGVTELHRADVGKAENTRSMSPSEMDMNDAPGQEISIRESCEMAEEDTLGPMESSSVVTLRETSVQEGRFLESPEESMDDGSSQVTEQTGSAESDVRDALDQEARFRESYETDLRSTLGKEVEVLYSFGSDGDDASGQGILMLEPHEADIGDASRPGQIAGFMESWGPEMGDIPREEAKIMYSPGPDLGDAFGQEAKFQELGKKDGGDTEVIYSPGLDMSVSSGQEAGVMEVHGLSESESSIQEARDLVLPESGVSDGLGQEVMMRETHEADVGNASAQGTELAHSPGPGVSDSVGQEVESMHSPGPSVGDSSGQEAEVTELHRADVGKAENTGSMSPSEMDMNDAPGQEISIRESCEMAEEDTLGPMESSSVVTLRETSVQEGRFLESPEESMDDGSSQITEQTGLAEPDVRDALDQEARFRESYETDLRGTLGKEVEVLYSFGPDGDDASGQGILMLEPHEADIGDASHPGQIAGFMESWGPEMGDIPREEAKIMYSPGPDLGDAFGQEAKFQELGKKDGGDTEVIYSPGPDMSVSSGQEAGVMEVHGLSESESSIQEARDLVLPESEVSDGLGQEVMMRETHEADVGNASAQGTELAHSPGPGVSDSVGQEVESMHSPGPSVGDSSGQEAEVTELHRADVGKAENTRSMSPSEMDMNDAPGQEISIRGSCEMAEEDTLGPMESSSVVTLRETSVQEGRFLESPEESMDDGSTQVTEQTGSAEPDVRDALDQEARFRESYETDLRSTLGKEVEVLYSFGPDGDDASGQEILMLEPHEADIGDASHPGQIAGFMESWGPEMGDIPREEAKIMYSPGPDLGDAFGQEAKFQELGKKDGGDTEVIYSPGPDMSVSSGQEAGFMEVHGLSESETPIQEARDLVLSETEVNDGQESGLKESVLAAEGDPIQEAEFFESPQEGVDDGFCQQIKQLGSTETELRGVPVLETKIFHSFSPNVGDYPHQETERLMDFSGPVVANFSDEGAQLTQSPGPNVGDALEEKHGNIESPRPDILPVIPEHGVLQDQSPDEVQRAEDRGLQSQAQEGSLFPKDGSGNTLDPEDSGQGLSIMVEAGAQAGSKVLGQQITATSLEPREEKRSGVIEETNLKIEAKRATASLVEGSPDPDYLFHVLFLGDSNVGKTTFLYLLHHNSFATGLAATVGMDYQIKNLVVDNRRFALQLWDTAGQERYHSITKQFLRKADGIVLMYDVTCPESFLHVRYWLDCLQEAGADDVAILLLGNKTDCVEERQVSTENGQLLAKEIGVAFGECSAALGHNILEPIVTLARAMQEQDNRLRHNLVDLEKKEVKKKAGCCS